MKKRTRHTVASEVLAAASVSISQGIEEVEIIGRHAGLRLAASMIAGAAEEVAEDELQAGLAAEGAKGVEVTWTKEQREAISAVLAGLNERIMNRLKAEEAAFGGAD